MKPELIEIVKEIKRRTNLNNAYLDTVPSEFIGCVYDNDYANNNGVIADIMAKALFGDMYDEIGWFWYEWKPNNATTPHLILVDGTEYIFNTEEQYYVYLRGQ